uniref:Putative secreted protein n=1 Tax=Anopheles triannulatus TaxID=58253 RepID=A0A2M4B1G2_9DIPT
MLQHGMNILSGCVWLSVISITVRATRQVPGLDSERFQRLAMLESNLLLENLLKLLYQQHETASTASPSSAGTDPAVERATSTPIAKGHVVIGENLIMMRQHLALDILIWITTIRLMRYRYPKNPFAKRASPGANRDATSPDLNVQQTECVQIIEKHLEPVVRHCIVLANRSVAHKCVKLLSLVLEGAQNMVDKNACSSFEQSLHQAIVACLPDTVNSTHAGALRWFMLLISGTTMPEHHLAVADSCLGLLQTVAEELRKRNNPFTALLRTRFGLHGAPFESELFDVHPMDARFGASGTVGGGGAAGIIPGFTCANGTGASAGISQCTVGGCGGVGGGGIGGGGFFGVFVVGGGQLSVDVRFVWFGAGAEVRCLGDPVGTRFVVTYFLCFLLV